MTHLKFRRSSAEHSEKNLFQKQQWSITPREVQKSEMMRSFKVHENQLQRYILEMRGAIQHEHFWNVKSGISVNDDLDRDLC